MKELLILIFLTCLQGQYVIPNIAHYGISIFKSGKLIKYHNELNFEKYATFETRDADGSNAKKHYSLGNGTLVYNKQDKTCAVTYKDFDNLAYIPRFRKCISSAISLTKFVVKCNEGEITFLPDEIGGYFIPSKFIGFNLKSDESGVFHKTEYFFNDNFNKYFMSIPNDVVCTGLEQVPFTLDTASYFVRKNQVEELKIKVSSSMTNMGLLFQRPNQTQIALINDAELWNIDENGCRRTSIELTGLKRKHTQTELAEHVWRENVMSEIKFYATYAFPEQIEGGVLVEKMRLETSLEDFVLFGERYRNAHLILITEEIHPKNYEMIVTFNGKQDLYSVFKLSQLIDLEGELIMLQKKKCNSDSMIKRMTLFSETLPKRKSYEITDVSAVTKAITTAFSSEQRVVSPIRIVDIRFGIQNQILNVDFEMSEPRQAQTKFLQLNLKQLTAATIYTNFSLTLSECFGICEDELTCEGVTFEGTKCISHANITFVEDLGSKNNSYLYMPYVRELSISNAMRVYDKNLPIVINMDGNEINLVDLEDSVVAIGIDDMASVNQFFQREPASISCEDPMFLLLPMTYTQCAIESQRLARNDDINGFAYDPKQKNCKLCRGSSKKSIDGDIKFKFNFINAYEKQFTKFIRDKLEKTSLKSLATTSIEECAEACELSADTNCIAFYFCSNVCFLSATYDMDKYEEGSKLEGKLCSANRRYDSTLFTRKPVKLNSNNLSNLQRVNKSDGPKTTIDLAENIGYLICENDSGGEYVVNGTTLDNLYGLNMRPDVNCEFREKVRKINSLIEADREVREIEYVGNSKGANAAIVIIFFIISVLASTGVSYYFMRRSLYKLSVGK